MIAMNQQFAIITPEIEEAASQVLSVVSEFLGINTLFIGLNDGQTNYIVRAINREKPLVVQGSTLPFSESYCRIVAQEAALVEVQNTGLDTRTQSLNVTKELGETTFIGIPIVLRDGRVVGTLCGMDPEPFHLTTKEEALLNAMAMLLARVLELERLAYIDNLTGLGNRHLISQYTHRSEHATRRAAVFWDMDNLKVINDRFGHHAGDRALQVVARVLKEELPESSIGCRMGGDEFVALISGYLPHEVVALVERTISRVRDYQEPLLPGVTVSITAGIATSREPESDFSWEELLRRADAAMYRGKHRGPKGQVFRIDL